ncbi:MAG: DUF262 domain-containing protein [Nitrosopumilus sp.]
MIAIKTYPMQNSAILRLNSERDEINIKPEYQREGGIWTKEKKQLLIDSILNDFDIPKLYFHALSPLYKEQTNSVYNYAIIDGRQRLETIWGFIEGEFALAEDFSYQVDENVNAGGMKYSDLAQHYPKLKIRFDSFNLPIVIVDTDDLDLIEDMFSRLNEAVPLNAAEKRNAIGGTMASLIREISKHRFFSQKVSFPDSRYQHREVTAKLLFIEETLSKQGKIIDTKKPYLDSMVRKYKESTFDELEYLNSKVINILDPLSSIFENSDRLLKTQTPTPIFYLVVKNAIEAGDLDKFNRQSLTDFYSTLIDNRRNAEKDITKANFDLLEFDRLSQQGTNDSNSIKERVRILKEFLKIAKQ